MTQSAREQSDKDIFGTKDVKRTESSKDTNEKDNLFILDNTELRTSPFGQNVSAESIYLRTERIVAAVFLMTSHIGHDESLRNDVRSAGVRLLQQTLAHAGELRATGSERVRDTLFSIRSMVSLVRFLGIAGYASLSNTQLVVSALDELGQAVTASQRSALAEDVALRKEDFVPRVTHLPRVKTHRTPTAERADGAGKRMSLRASTMLQKDKFDTKDTSNNLRGDRIVDVLRAGGLLGIKDIAASLPEYSEKMIQRELLGLVSDNRVRKIGSKRWSRYQITS